MNKPLISVIIPFYNAINYVEETIESLIQQTYNNWECILIDDGSNDGTDIIVKKYCNNDSRFSYYYQTNGGPSIARNNGLLKAKGEYIQFLDSDDVLICDRFEIMVSEYNNTSKNIIFYSDYYLGDNDNIYKTKTKNRPANTGKDILFKDMYSQFAKDFLIIPACVLYPSYSLKNITWDERLKHSEDWEFYLNVLNKNYIFRFLPHKLAIYRNTISGLSKDYENTIKTNYMILEKWAGKGNYSSYFIKSARIMSNNVIKLLNGKCNELIIPKFYKHRILYLTKLMIIILTAGLFVINIIIIQIVKKIVK